MIYHQKIEYLNSAELLKYIHGQLQPINDLELLLLKGHLMIEHVFNQVIIRFSRTDEKGKEKLLRFRFMEKLSLIEFIGVFFRNDGQVQDAERLKAQIAKVNGIRNKLSHNLDYDKNLIPAFIQEYKDLFDFMQKKGTKIPLTDAGKLDLLLTGICGHIVGRADSLIAVNNGYAELTTPDFKKQVISEVVRYIYETNEDIRGTVNDINNDI